MFCFAGAKVLIDLGIGRNDKVRIETQEEVEAETVQEANPTDEVGVETGIGTGHAEVVAEIVARGKDTRKKEDRGIDLRKDQNGSGSTGKGHGIDRIG